MPHILSLPSSLPAILCLCLTVAAAAAAVILVYMRRSAAAVVLETVRLSDDEDGATAPRVVQISDIHITTRATRVDALRPLLKEAVPDVVVLTGDYVESPKDTAEFLAWTRGLMDILREIPHVRPSPTVLLCFGNHDNRAFHRFPELRRMLEKELKRLGVQILENRTHSFTANGKRYDITGYADISSPRFNIARARSGMSKDAAFTLGFSHNPDLALALGRGKPDLFLCGHFHGGQIRLPFHIEYTCLRGERLCRMGLRQGLYKLGARLVYISRGLGCVLIPLRLASKPEITLFLLP